jgi:hypothetical protein
MDFSSSFNSSFSSGQSFRPQCAAGVHSPANTSLKWAADGELTALDLHHVMARLCAEDPQAAAALGILDP